MEKYNEYAKPALVMGIISYFGMSMIWGIITTIICGVGFNTIKENEKGKSYLSIGLFFGIFNILRFLVYYG